MNKKTITIILIKLPDFLKNTVDLYTDRKIFIEYYFSLEEKKREGFNRKKIII